MNSVKFWFCTLFFCIANIPFSMTLSTLFQDSKIANSIGGLIVFIPILLFLQLVQSDSDNKYLIYLLFWLPVVPTCSLLAKFSTRTWVLFITVQGQIQPLPPIEIFKVQFIENSACWIFLVLDIVFWLLFYFYLDSVMPNEYGI